MMAEGRRSRRLCKCKRGWGFDIGGGGNPMMGAWWEDMMSRCTIGVNWLAWWFVVHDRIGSKMWASEVRGSIGVWYLGWSSIGLI